MLEKLYANNSVFLLSLLALFAVSFTLPLVFAFKIGGFLYNPATPGVEDVSKASLFPESPQVAGVNSYLSIQNSSSIEPEEGKDFLLSFWLKFRKLPAPNERMVILSKFDAESASRRGYAFALSRDDKEIYPEIYWRDDSNNGTWSQFPQFDLQGKVWNLFVISFRNGKFLGLHNAAYVELSGKDMPPPEIRVLGGYELENKILPKSSSDLLLGAFNLGKFRGQIGPVGIFSKKNMTEDLDKILQALVENPSEAPEHLSGDEVKLWSKDGKIDESNFKNVIEFVKTKRVEGD